MTEYRPQHECGYTNGDGGNHPVPQTPGFYPQTPYHCTGPTSINSWQHHSGNSWQHHWGNDCGDPRDRPPDHQPFPHPLSAHHQPFAPSHHPLSAHHQPFAPSHHQPFPPSPHQPFPHPPTPLLQPPSRTEMYSSKPDYQQPFPHPPTLLLLAKPDHQQTFPHPPTPLQPPEQTEMYSSDQKPCPSWRKKVAVDIMKRASSKRKYANASFNKQSEFSLLCDCSSPHQFFTHRFYGYSIGKKQGIGQLRLEPNFDKKFMDQINFVETIGNEELIEPRYSVDEITRQIELVFLSYHLVSVLYHHIMGSQVSPVVMLPYARGWMEVTGGEKECWASLLQLVVFLQKDTIKENGKSAISAAFRSANPRWFGLELDYYLREERMLENHRDKQRDIFTTTDSLVAVLAGAYQKSRSQSRALFSQEGIHTTKGRMPTSVDVGCDPALFFNNVVMLRITVLAKIDCWRVKVKGRKASVQKLRLHKKRRVKATISQGDIKAKVEKDENGETEPKKKVEKVEKDESEENEKVEKDESEENEKVEKDESEENEKVEKDESEENELKPVKKDESEENELKPVKKDESEENQLKKKVEQVEKDESEENQLKRKVEQVEKDESEEKEPKKKVEQVEKNEPLVIKDDPGTQDTQETQDGTSEVSHTDYSALPEEQWEPMRVNDVIEYKTQVGQSETVKTVVVGIEPRNAYPLVLKNNQLVDAFTHVRRIGAFDGTRIIPLVKSDGDSIIRHLGYSKLISCFRLEVCGTEHINNKQGMEEAKKKIKKTLNEMKEGAMAAFNKVPDEITTKPVKNADEDVDDDSDEITIEPVNDDCNGVAEKDVVDDGIEDVVLGADEDMAVMGVKEGDDLISLGEISFVVDGNDEDEEDENGDNDDEDEDEKDKEDDLSMDEDEDEKDKDDDLSMDPFNFLKPLSRNEKKRYDRFFRGHKKQDDNKTIGPDKLCIGSIKTLGDGQWVSAEIIKTFLLRVEENRKSSSPSRTCLLDPVLFTDLIVHVARDAETNRFKKVVSGGQLGILYKKARFSRTLKRNRVDCVIDLEKLIIPVNHHGCHWFLIVAYMKEKRIQVYDSMAGLSRMMYLKVLLKYIRKNYEENKGKKMRGWKKWKLLETDKKMTPQQCNGHDCGIFTCLAAERIYRGAELDYKQSEVSNIRKRIALYTLQSNK
ncbi:unnamed protein product [Cylindrotheca closterium]|uniref:Ubiquitin-like protease family profile domain-containing protein n=1 Tax=Cylindrotheca closterium TaxID=2856 RepID=A0AAD2PUI7_9STRA|nr:unnamed protein product [Cylindrotheca closterium]